MDGQSTSSKTSHGAFHLSSFDTAVRAWAARLTAQAKLEPKGLEPKWLYIYIYMCVCLDVCMYI